MVNKYDTETKISYKNSQNCKDLTDDLTHLNKENGLLIPRVKSTNMKIIYTACFKNNDPISNNYI